MSMFGEMLRIKRHRESRAEQEVLRAGGELASAVAAREQAETTLRDYRDWALRRERELYQALCEKPVRLRDIEDVQFSVVELRGGERSRQEALDHAEKARVNAAEQLDRARNGHRDAVRMKEKFVELVQNFDQERLAELQRLEDLEMEEVRAVRNDEDEQWEAPHE
ncbi:type III secretion system stalk subunit SctO [Chitinimonas lacunae]|uniref:YscO family type III secretion system apparatus protein n=1 Tax=Chitinimonas lacunae TaxID=1963018 RepID=A0ABV8MSI8_9NEIS